MNDELNEARAEIDQLQDSLRLVVSTLTKIVNEAYAAAGVPLDDDRYDWEYVLDEISLHARVAEGGDGRG